MRGSLGSVGVLIAYAEVPRILGNYHVAYRDI